MELCLNLCGIISRDLRDNISVVDNTGPIGFEQNHFDIFFKLLLV